MYLEETKGHSLNSHNSIGLQPWLNYKPWSYNAGTDQPCNVRMAGTEDAVLQQNPRSITHGITRQFVRHT
jgi:hypothetical protein